MMVNFKFDKNHPDQTSREGELEKQARRTVRG